MPYTVTNTDLPDVLVLEPGPICDDSEFSFESFSSRDFQAATGLNKVFVQDNHSRSTKGVIRGLHFQIQRPQGKLIRVTTGEIFDVAVDVRQSSPNFGKWAGVILSADNRLQLWIPEGFAHGFLVLSDVAEVSYKATDYYAPEFDCCIIWDDPVIDIAWPVEQLPILSARDQQGLELRGPETFSLIEKSI